MNKLKKYIYRGFSIICLSSTIISINYAYKHNSNIEQNEKLLYSEKTSEILTHDSKKTREISTDDYSNSEKKGTVINVETRLNVRIEPSIDSSICHTLNNGETVIIIGEKEGWYKIKYNNNIIGYVKSDYVEENNLNKDCFSVTLDVKTNVKEDQISQLSTQNLNDMSQAKTENTTQNNIKTISMEKKSSEEAKAKKINVELTAYCNDEECSGEWGGITALGTETRVGVVAAPSSISLGSKLYIPELSYYKTDSVFDVEDRGGAVKIKDDGTYIIDVWFPTHEQVENFGRVKSIAYILE